MKRILGIIIVVAVVSFSLWVQGRYVVPILTYHNVGPLSSQFAHLNTVSTEAFDAQMTFLHKHGYNVISFDQLIEAFQNKERKLPRNTVVIQFDDGYKNNYTEAFPILKKYNFPATIFLVSDKIGRDSYFLNWEEVKEMEKFGVMAGAHTRFHRYLPELTLEKAKDEIEGSKKIIEQNLEHSVDYFSYPSGAFTSEVKQIVRQAGFKAAVTTNRGQDKFNRDLFELNRIRVNTKDSRYGALSFWAKCSGYYNVFRKIKENKDDREKELGY